MSETLSVAIHQRAISSRSKPQPPLLIPREQRLNPANVPAVYTICDSTSSACTNYVWRVRNICIKNDDPTFSLCQRSQFQDKKCVGGGFTAPNSYTVSVYPNPAYDKIVIKATIPDVSSVKIMIANMNGRVMFQKNVAIINGKLELPVSLSQFEKNVYFVTVSDGKTVIKTSFTKQ